LHYSDGFVSCKQLDPITKPSLYRRLIPAVPALEDLIKPVGEHQFVGAKGRIADAAEVVIVTVGDPEIMRDIKSEQSPDLTPGAIDQPYLKWIDSRGSFEITRDVELHLVHVGILDATYSIAYVKKVMV